MEQDSASSVFAGLAEGSDRVTSFWDNLDRIYQGDYIPSEADLLHVRIRTMGYDDAVFNFKDTAFRVTVR